MVFFDLAADVPVSADYVAGQMREAAGVWVGTNGPRGFRAVTHYWIGDDDVDIFLSSLQRVLALAAAGLCPHNA